MSVDDLTRWLFGRTGGGIKWGLGTTKELLAGVGDPHRRFRSLHVAGTNGKGSVCAICDAALRADGRHRIGLYTSPHLVTFAERIRVDGAPAPYGLVEACLERLTPAIERTGASFFEATTALAFLCFAELEVDLAVVEVGLGGRLDSTSVLTPDVSVVTSIGLDHQSYLGATVQEIAREKAGIFKPGVPAVIGEGPGAARDELERVARAAGAPVVRVSDAVRVDTRGGDGAPRFHSATFGALAARPALKGTHQFENAATAIAALGALPPELRPSPGAVIRGVEGVRWPGRLQIERIRGTTWLLDVAHNPAGASALAAAMGELDLPRPVVLVVAVLADKDWRGMLGHLLPAVDAVVPTEAPGAPAGRAWALDEVADWLAAGQVRAAVRPIPDLDAALERAATMAPHGTVVVTGSFHTVGDALTRLGIPTLGG